ncbi:hypothetical protein P8C59_007926 [Phyllachora maydis]|uniref:AB hydrolase-1 domain-containing protein n=1 Tax=Phyllachora maydis TaxID=1825666 RepID=A0AAD9IA29_9PEZI|nr:hypothetical protein P8C59_007926 [Phyllachora maydis]
MGLPTILIVPGAWELPHAFDPLMAQLTRAGFDSSVVSLPSVGGTSNPLPGFADDVAQVRTELIKLVSKGQEVVVYCHSYGGVVGSNAVEGLDTKSRASEGKSGGVKALVYASAFMLPKKTSLLDMLGGEPLPWMVVDRDRVYGNASMIQEVAFNDLSEKDAAHWATQMTYTSLSVFTAESAYTPWTGEIPSYYLFGTNDNALPFSYQEKMAAQLPEGSLTESGPSGHCAHLSRPVFVTSILSRWFGA